jgi:lysophospholipase L1-like esterase
MGNTPIVYETYEWDNTWIEHADDSNRKRVLYIGDSISCGTRHIATNLTDCRILFDGFGTSKALDNPYFEDMLRLFAAQEGRRDAVLFNNGLHGFHLDDKTEYRNDYDKMVQFLLSEFRNTPIFILLTTHVADEAQNKRVILRNLAATEVAKKYHLPTIDLYSVSAAMPDQLTDGVHFTQSGYQALAQTILNALSAI